MKKILAIGLFVITAAPVWASDPPARIVLGSRHGHAVPKRCGWARTAGGNIRIVQPSPDVVVITMTGAVIATGHPCKESRASMTFELDQEFKIIPSNPEKPLDVKLVLDTHLLGLLRAGGEREFCYPEDNDGVAGHGEACASVLSGPQRVLSMCVDPHVVRGRHQLSINCRKGPFCAPVLPGCFTLHGKFNIRTTHKRSLLPCRPASAEFASGALTPKWVDHRDPFHRAAKDDFGFRITLRVVGKEIAIPTTNKAK